VFAFAVWRQAVPNVAIPMLDSSAIRSVSYDALAAQLHITFQNGRTYTFYRVPSAIYHGLLTASSAGHYYYAYIRGRFGP
jgi:hypothetical protein